MYYRSRLAMLRACVENSGEDWYVFTRTCRILLSMSLLPDLGLFMIVPGRPVVLLMRALTLRPAVSMRVRLSNSRSNQRSMFEILDSLSRLKSVAALPALSFPRTRRSRQGHRLRHHTSLGA